MSKAKLAWVQDEEMMSYTLLNLISLSSVIYLCFRAVTALDSTVVASLSSVQFSRSVMFGFLRPHGLHDARLPCPSPTPEACSDSSCPSSLLCRQSAQSKS